MSVKIVVSVPVLTIPEAFAILSKDEFRIEIVAVHER